MAIISNTVCYKDGDTTLEALFAFDDSITTRRPVVLIQHTWCGRDEFVANKARQLAELGYVGFAVDMYGKGVLGTNPEENARLMQPFMDDRAMLQQRVHAALAAAKCLPWVDDSQCAAIGFCFGGLCVLDLARTGVAIKGVVSFHGILNAPDNTQGTAINAKVLVLHGHDDPLARPEQVLAFQNEMTAVGADWQVHVYGNTVHAFTNPLVNDVAGGFSFNAAANSRSWQAMGNFLAEIFV
jgi:dienelactone hydrolase